MGGFHIFPKGINPKVNVIARLEFELAYFEFKFAFFEISVLPLSITPFRLPDFYIIE